MTEVFASHAKKNPSYLRRLDRVECHIRTGSVEVAGRDSHWKPFQIEGRQIIVKTVRDMIGQDRKGWLGSLSRLSIFVYGSDVLPEDDRFE